MPKMLSTYQVNADMIGHAAGVVRETMQGHIADVFSVRESEDAEGE